MTQYLLSVWHSPENPFPDDPAVMQKAYEQVDAFNSKLIAAGAWVFGGGLHDPSSATVVRGTDGDPIMTDGPFAETKEQLGGFWIITAPDLDAALAWAAEGSTACMGPSRCARSRTSPRVDGRDRAGRRCRPGTDLP
jgi:hypothetical protein